jgi:AcrR family transcriptional regulator
MPAREKTEKVRQKIIEATDELLYQKGFNLMSFSDIAEVSEVPRGNIYYHFKSKDDVLAAVIEYRTQQTQSMLQNWQQEIPRPLERLKRFARIPLQEKERVIQYGCPMGTLNAELGKSQQPLKPLVKQQMDVFRSWLAEQFTQCCPEQVADELAEHLLVRAQGLSALAHLYANDAIILREVEKIEDWLLSL